MKKRSTFLLLIIILVDVGYNITGRLYPMDYYDTVKQYSDKYGLNPFFIMAVIKTESNFDQNAVSSKGASGLMQITDDTAQWCCERLGTDYSGEMLFNPEFNISIGTYYLEYLLDRYDGDLSCAICAYNAGMGNADKWLENEKYSPDGEKIISTPFQETTGYLNKVKFNQRIYQFLYGGDKK